MSQELPRRKMTAASRKNQAAGQKDSSAGGFHFGDYRPRYKEPFDIYEKAKEHARQQRKNETKKKK